MRRATREEKQLLHHALRRWRGPILPDGLPKKRRSRPTDFDPDQLAKGVKVELEHTNKPEIALEIAMAHLLERDDYYEMLEKLERSPRRQRRRS